MLDMTELVRQVVREVLAQEAGAGRTRAGAFVRVLAPRDAALEGRLAPLVAALHPEGAQLRFEGEDLGGRGPARVILPALGCADMADLACGRAGSERARTVLDLLLRGQPVEVLDFEYEAYAQTAAIPLYELYAGYERTLATYGLRRFRPAPPSQIKVHATLIAADVVERAAAEGARTLVVPTGAIVTPLAADAAKATGVAIIKQS